MSKRPDSLIIPASSRDLWARAAHDLRQPIQSLLLQTAIIAGTQEAADRQKKARHMEDLLIALQSMLKDLGWLSQIEAGEEGLSPVKCKLADIVARVVQTLAEIVSERNVTLKIDIPSISLTSDAALLQKVIAGLVLNGLQQSTGPEIVLGARQSRVTTHFDVDFVGAPILPPRQALAFIELQSLKGAAIIRRTALGLGFVGHLAETLGATIACSSLDAQWQRLELALPSSGPVQSTT